jgi:hypothetical protein
MNSGRLARAGLDPATPWPWLTASSAAAPGLVACPVALVGFYAAPGVVQELYRVAYERARAAARPSRYELAFHSSPN